MKRKQKKWVVTSDSVGLRSCRRFLEVNCTEPSHDGSFMYFPVATANYTGQFRRKHLNIAERLAKALNEADGCWASDEYTAVSDGESR
jgi:hypothetical protein